MVGIKDNWCQYALNVLTQSNLSDSGSQVIHVYILDILFLVIKRQTNTYSLTLVFFFCRISVYDILFIYTGVT